MVQKGNTPTTADLESYRAEVNLMAARMKAKGAFPVIMALSQGQDVSVERVLQQVWNINKWPLSAEGRQTDQTYRLLAADVLVARAEVQGDKMAGKAFRTLSQRIRDGQEETPASRSSRIRVERKPLRNLRFAED